MEGKKNSFVEIKIPSRYIHAVKISDSPTSCVKHTFFQWYGILTAFMFPESFQKASWDFSITQRSFSARTPWHKYCTLGNQINSNLLFQKRRVLTKCILPDARLRGFLNRDLSLLTMLQVCPIPDLKIEDQIGQPDNMKDPLIPENVRWGLGVSYGVRSDSIDSKLSSCC